MARPDAKEILKQFEEAVEIRRPYEQDFRLASAYCMPRQYATWQQLGPVEHASQAMSRRAAYDNTGIRSLPKFAAILNRIGTPDGQRWHKMRASNQDLMKLHNVRKYFDDFTNLLFKMRYEPRARFTQSSGETYLAMGLYGMGPNSITWRKPSPLDRKGGLAYKAWHLSSIFILTDDEGNVTHVFRQFHINARQFAMKFGRDNAPSRIAQEMDKPAPDEKKKFEIIHVLCPRSDYKKDAVDVRRHPIIGSYLSKEDAAYIGEEEGFASMPMLTPRVATEAGDLYGYSVAIQALPALGGVSAMKRTMLKAGHKAVDPTLLAHDDGVLSGRVDMRPGAVLWGGINAQGQQLVKELAVGRFDIGKELIADERKDIEDSFLVTLFQMFAESPEMTATEVIERISDRAALVAPTMGRLQAEQLGPQVEREAVLLIENGRAPEMPPELVEAQGEYEVLYTSALAKNMYSEEITGFMRWCDILYKHAEVTQDPTVTFQINMGEAAPEIAEYLAVRTSWVNDTKVVEAKTQEFTKAREQEALLKQAPAGASVVNTMMKANGGPAKGMMN